MNRSILIADDDEDVVELLSRRCKALGLEVDSTNNAMTALGKAEEHLPDLVILDVEMPFGNGLSVCEMMAAHEELCCIPVIILTGSTKQETVRRCHELSAYYVLKSPDLWSRVEPVLQDVLGTEKQTTISEPTLVQETGEREPMEHCESNDLMDSVFAVLGVELGDVYQEEENSDEAIREDQPWVLSIEDDDDIALALSLRLKEYGVRVIRSDEGMEGYRKAFLNSPRAIILDYELPQGNGDYVLRRLKETESTRDIPVIVLTGRKEASIERQMRGLGASEFLTKPFDWNRLRKALHVSLDEGHATHDTPTCEVVPSEG